MERLSKDERQALIRIMKRLDQKISSNKSQHPARFKGMLQESVEDYVHYFNQHPDLLTSLRISKEQLKSLTPQALLKRIEDALLNDDVLQGDDLSKLRALLLKLQTLLIKQNERDEAFGSPKFERQNFWGMYEKNNYPYIMFFDNHPSVKHALHIITAEDMYQKPMLKGCVFDAFSQERLTHKDVLDRIFLYQKHQSF